MIVRRIVGSVFVACALGWVAVGCGGGGSGAQGMAASPADGGGTSLGGEAGLLPPGDAPGGADVGGGSVLDVVAAAEDVGSQADVAARPGVDGTSDAGALDGGGAPPDAGPEFSGDCCEPQPGPGCGDDGVVECLCAEMPECCHVQWTQRCIDGAAALCQLDCSGGPPPRPAPGCGDGVCQEGESCAGCPDDCGPCPPDGPCCEAHETPRCDDEAVTKCVCEADDWCCKVHWDPLCVSEASGCGADCGPAPSCGDGSCDDGAEPPEDCVSCPQDCGPCPALGDCCDEHPDPGCNVEAVSSCVCDADPFCCNSEWDALCVEAAGKDCNAGCVAAPPAVCGDGLCDSSEDCETCPLDCGLCPGTGSGGSGDCCEAHSSTGCSNTAVQQCVCGADPFCCDSEWDEQCAGAAPGCGAECGGGPGPGTCECPWLDAGDCGVQTAVFEVVALDIWARPLDGAAVSVDAAAGTEGATGSLSVPLCGALDMTVTVGALDHHGLDATVSYDGLGGPDSLSVSAAVGPTHAAWVLTTRIEPTPAGQVRHYTLWAGLPHQWFAATGRPPRAGNQLDLLMDGEETWLNVYADSLLVADHVVVSTWWWTSEIEWVRDPDTHIWLSPDERWLNTAMGVLEGLFGVERKVLVNQFYSQDGILSWVTVDDPLVEKATTPGDDFEFLGMANDAHGKFTVSLPDVDLAARIAEAGVAPAGTKTVAAAPLPPPVGPVDVDTNALPLGVGALSIPAASWHQKFLGFDGKVAYVGGMNVKTTDWDTSDHAVFEYRRMAFDATADERLAVKNGEAEPDFGPRKDYMIRIEGPAAADVEAVFASRWQHQLDAGVVYADLSTPFEAPSPAAPQPNGTVAQVLTTMPKPFDEHGILESLVRAVSNAEHYIYIEDQYFRAPLLYEHIIARMQAVPDLELIVVTNPINEWVDPGCWQTYLALNDFADLFPGRFHAFRTVSFAAVDTGCTLCIDEVDAHFEEQDLHSKLVMVDDRYLLVGSANSNNRGYLYEGEMSVAVYDVVFVHEVRERIFANLLGDDVLATVDVENLAGVFEQAAASNQAVWDAWEAEGFDLDLNGAPLPDEYVPRGFLFPLFWGDPTDCFIEGVGEDVT